MVKFPCASLQGVPALASIARRKTSNDANIMPENKRGGVGRISGNGYLAAATR
ncbi:hypothetical protein D1AOALGA4SA_3574 [Olavius algarvensis Delta 1 endosymbiont]|nr:hypothetical protein D1AOALGA4SA_3574 [Olavius algarvensis Delta 1 endosymbiont]